MKWSLNGGFDVSGTEIDAASGKASRRCWRSRKVSRKSMDGVAGGERTLNLFLGLIPGEKRERPGKNDSRGRAAIPGLSGRKKGGKSVMQSHPGVAFLLGIELCPCYSARYEVLEAFSVSGVVISIHSIISPRYECDYGQARRAGGIRVSSILPPHDVGYDAAPGYGQFRLGADGQFPPPIAAGRAMIAHRIYLLSPNSTDGVPYAGSVDPTEYIHGKTVCAEDSAPSEEKPAQ